MNYKICLLAFGVLLIIGCNNVPERTSSKTLPLIYDVSTDKTSVRVGEELTVTYYTKESQSQQFDFWDAEVRNGKLITKDTSVDITHIICFGVEITDDQLVMKTFGGHTRYSVSGMDYPSTFVMSEIVKYYHFDTETRITTVTVIVPDGAKSGYIKTNDNLSVGGVGFCPVKLTIVE